MPTSTTASPKERYLAAHDDEHERTMRVLRAFPADKTELRPHPKLKTARELAFIFVVERSLARMLMENAFAKGMPAGKPREAPASWQEVLTAVEQSHREFADYVRSLPDASLEEMSTFMVGPKQMKDIRRLDLLWFLLHDEIHHRGQLSVYLRMADAPVPSIYGPSGDEPWL